MSAKQYDTLSDEAILRLGKQAISAYSPCRDATLRLLCRSENATLLVMAAGKKYALRIHRGSTIAGKPLSVSYHGLMRYRLPELASLKLCMMMKVSEYSHCRLLMAGAVTPSCFTGSKVRCQPPGLIQPVSAS
ncbi:MAG: hypothetical protein XXXJIFNMEKO3_00765 [Candidatus Erwinia impunctatus]|nr:hypothetical protein XXXJIFNMEKO_00765 [Culicoides impunctatus]